MKKAYLALILGVGIGLLFWQRGLPTASEEQDTVCEWARLKAFPVNSSQLKIISSGNIFTRELTIELSATPAAIKAWVEESPGLKEAIVETLPGGRLHYRISPKHGAQFAEATITMDFRHVKVRVYWS